jgi:sarcosine oxidase subunit beta
VFEDDDEEAYARQHCLLLAAAGIHLDVVDGVAARRIQPLLRDGLRGAIWSPSDIVVGPRELTEALCDGAVRAGAIVRLHEAALGLIRDGERIVGVRTSAGAVLARWVVNAAGLGAADLGADVGIMHPVIPRKGQLISVEGVPEVAPVRVTSARELMHKHAPGARSSALGIGLTPKPGGVIILGGTTEEVGLDTTVDPIITAGIALAAVRLFPALGSATAVAAWSGFRPYVPGGPLLGADPAHPGYLIAAGHGGDGVALAPVSGKYLAAVMARGRNLAVEDFLAP